MKKLRKLVSLLLAVVMLTSLSVCGGATASTTGTIEISQATDGAEYAVYKILDLTYNETTGSYAYHVDTTSDWYNFFATGAGSYYVDVDDNGYVTWKTSVDTDTETMQEFGSAIKTHITQNDIQPTDSTTATGDTVTFEDLDLGYYYVTSTVGSLIALTSTATAAQIVDKNDKPTIEKSVSNDGTNYDDDYVTADLTDTIYFRIVIEGIDEIYSLTFYDKLPNCYSLVSNSISINLVDCSGNSYSLSDNNNDDKYYTLDTASVASTANAINVPDSYDFKIDFDALFDTDEYATYVTNTTTPDSAYIEIIYSVTVNTTYVAISSTDDATANTNKAYIYSSTGVLKEDDASVYYYDLYIYKYDGDTNDALEGAEFTLSYTDSSGTYYAIVDDDGYLTGWAEDEDEATTLTTDENGFIYIQGLDVDDYDLTETAAPDGYAMPANADTKVSITADSTTHIETVTPSEDQTYGTEDVKAVSISNSTSSAMPSTGGIGVTIFYVFGGIIVVAAAALIVVYSRKRAKAER